MKNWARSSPASRLISAWSSGASMRWISWMNCTATSFLLFTTLTLARPRALAPERWPRRSGFDSASGRMPYRQAGVGHLGREAAHVYGREGLLGHQGQGAGRARGNRHPLAEE